MSTKASEQYDFKVHRDPLNQLPSIFATNLSSQTIEELLTKYYIFHHYGLSLGKNSKTIVDKRFIQIDSTDVRNIEFDSRAIAKELYRLELNQTEYFARKCAGHTLLDNKKILDIGSGSGGMTFYLAEQHNANLAALNLSGKQVELLKKVIKLRRLDKKVVVYKGDMNSFTLENVGNKKFDIILQNETDMYVDNHKEFMKHIYSILEPGGIYATISWYKTNNSTNTQVIDNYYFTNMQNFTNVKTNIESAGFDILDIVELSEEAKPYWYLRNLFEHSKGVVEGEFIGGLENGSIKYSLIVAQKDK